MSFPKVLELKRLYVIPELSLTTLRYLLHVSFVSSDKTWDFPFNDSYILIKSSVSVVSDAEQCFNL